MKKIIFLLVTLIAVCFFVCACDSKISAQEGENKETKTVDTPATVWLNGDKKADFNNDGKIDESDYDTYLEYNAWLVSDKSNDLNDDKRINYSDFEKYNNFIDWFKSDEAIDLNNDKKIKIDDYEAYCNYLAWKTSESSIDVNEDNVININDYIIIESKEYKDYVSWTKSEQVFDYNGDGKTDKTDYETHVAYNDWLNGNKADDLNNDRKINYSDYKIFLNPTMTEYDKWLISDNAKDYTLDGKVTEVDYQKYTLFGSYKVLNLKVLSKDGRNFYFKRSNQSFYYSDDTLEQALVGLYFVVDENGVKAEIPESFKELLVEEDLSLIEKTFASMKIVPISSEVVALDSKTTIENFDIDITFYFIKIGDNKYETTFSLDYDYENTEYAYSFSFQLIKI